MSGSGSSGRTLLTIAPGHFVYDERVLRTVEIGRAFARSYYAVDREFSERLGSDGEAIGREVARRVGGNLRLVLLPPWKRIRFLSRMTRQLYALRVGQQARSLAPDVVHIHESGILGLLIAFWVRRMVPRARIIFDYHDWIPSEIASSVRGIRPLYAPAMAASMPLMRFLARAVDVAVCISPGQAEWTREALGIAQTRVIQNVRPLMAAPELGGAEFRPEFLFAGNVMRIRRLEFVIDVVAMLRERGVETLLSICGDFTEPDYVQELRERVTRSGLDELVRFHGRYRGDEELGRIAGRGAVGITMGLEERVDTRVNRIASANKFFSYLALGLPVLVEESYENMLRIVEEGAAGASFRTCEECADAATGIWRTPQAWEEMRENALRLTRRMNAATYAGVLEELYA